MTNKPCEILAMAMDSIQKTGGNPETADLLMDLIGDAPILSAVRRGEATMGDAKMIRLLAERKFGPRELDVTLMIMGELLYDMAAMAEASGARLHLSGAYQAAKGLVSGKLSDADAIRVCGALQESVWRRSQDETRRLLHPFSVWSQHKDGADGGKPSAVQPAMKLEGL